MVWINPNKIASLIMDSERVLRNVENISVGSKKLKSTGKALGLGKRLLRFGYEDKATYKVTRFAGLDHNAW